MKLCNSAGPTCYPGRLTTIAVLVALFTTSFSAFGVITIDAGTTVTVDGAGTLPEWIINDSLRINGEMNILNGGAVTTIRTGGNNYDYIGDAAGSTGIVTVTGAGSSWSNINGIYVGNSGNGYLTISEGAALINTGAFNYNYLGYRSGSTGVMTVTGAGSTWSTTGSSTVGHQGNGSLTVSDGASVSVGTQYIGNASGSNGTTTVTGMGSSLDVANLYVGNIGNGQLAIINGATVRVNTLFYIGNNADSTGSVEVAGEGSSLSNRLHIEVGSSGNGRLAITDGATVSNSTGYIGKNAGSIGTVEVTGEGSDWSNSIIEVGSSGNGRLVISDGATVSNSIGYIGRNADSTGVVEANGNGSSLSSSGNIVVGNSGDGRLVITDGATVNSNADAYIGNEVGSTGTVEVAGEGSSWSNSGVVAVGNSGNGRLAITDGATVNSNLTAYIGSSAGSTGTATVTGAGSIWDLSGALRVGNVGEGSLTVSDGATVSAESVVLANYESSSGMLNIGAAEGQEAVAAGQLNVDSITFGAGTGMLTLNHTSTDFTLAADISGSGTVNALSGTSALTGNNSGFQGYINIDAPATLVISSQENIGTNDVSMTGGTLAIDTVQDWQFTNGLNGNGTLSVDTDGNRFDFVSPSFASTFSGVLALKDTLFSLAGTNTDALQNTLLKLGSGSVATAGDGQQTIDGLAFDGGTLVMGTITPGQTTTGNTVHTTGQLDISGSGSVQVTAGIASNDTPVPDSSVSLLSQDDRNVLVQLVSTDGAVTGSGGSLKLTDQNGSIISDGVTAGISQNGSVVAQGTWDYRLTSGDNNDGLYVNYGLTQVELAGRGNDALVLNSEGRTGSAADLSARLTGSGDLGIDTGTGNTVSLSNLDNDYTGITDIRSGTLLMQNDGVLGATSMLQMAQGTALEMNGHRQTTGSVNIEDDARVNLDGGHLEITQGGSISGGLTGSGSLALTGDRLTVDGENRTLSAGITVASGATADLNDAQGLGTGAMALAGQVNLNGADGMLLNALSDGGTLALRGSQIQLTGDNTDFSGTFSVDADSRMMVSAVNRVGSAVIENAGLLELSADDNWQISNSITGSGSLAKYGRGMVALGADSVAYTGTTDVYSGGLTFGERDNPVTLASSQVSIHEAGLLAGNGVIAGNVNNLGVLQVGAPATEAAAQAATVSTLAATQDSLTIDGDLVNGGLVQIRGTSGSSQPGNRLVVNGDYTGDNGHLVFGTALNDDTSLTDHMTVAGDTSGTTHVRVSNMGGQGAATTEGIELIRVGGNAGGEFVQDGRIVAGAYDYSLVRGSDGTGTNWYLTSQSNVPVEPSEPQNPGSPAPQFRPEAGSYLANNQAANTLFMTSFDDRPGETRYTDILTGEEHVTSLWMRNTGSHTRFRDGSGQLKTQANSYVVQLGGDLAQWSTDGTDRWHLGAMAGYGRSDSHTRSELTGYRSRGTLSGYSAGLYGTWYANDTDKTGMYVDTWALYNWFDNTVTGQEQASEKYKSAGVTASVETGYSLKLGESGRNSYWLQPQAQAVWMDVRADDHREQNGTRVTDDGRGNLQTRLGMKAYISGHNAIDDDKNREFRPFVEANWLHNTRDTRVKMDDVSNNLDGAKNIGEVKLGVEGQITPRLAVWGNVAQQVGDKGYSDTQGGLGVRYNW